MALSFGASGQSRQIPAPAQSEPIVIRGATVHTVAGPVYDSGFVRFEGGVITALGRGDGPETSATVINADGLHVYPGLIAADTNIGLVETGAVDGGNAGAGDGQVVADV